MILLAENDQSTNAAERRARSDARPPVRIVVVLAGVSGRLADVRAGLGRNFIDLPGPGGRSLLAEWLGRLVGLLGPRAGQCLVRLSVDDDAPPPMLVTAAAPCPFEIVRDPTPARGTAGVLRDVTRDLDDDEDVLVVQASDLAWTWSEAEGARLLSSHADVVLSADRDLRPAGPLRVRSGLLKRIPSVGFVDLKEQFLPRCAAAVDVVRSDRRRSGGLHSLRQYLAAVAGDGDADAAGASVAGARPWRPGCARVESGAEVDAAAVLFESVVLRGARVGRNAVVVRSLIGDGVVIGPGEQVVDQTLVAGDGSRRRRAAVAW